MSDKKIPQHKEIAMGIEGKYAAVKGRKDVVNKKCGGVVKRKK